MLREICLLLIFGTIALALAGCGAVALVDGAATVAGTAVKGAAKATGGVIDYAAGSSERKIQVSEKKARYYRDIAVRVCARTPNMPECDNLH